MRLALTLLVAAHGIGHILFLVPLLGITNWGQSTRSWLLTNSLGETLTTVIGSVVWVAATAGFTAAALGLYAQTPWWRGLLVAASLVSLAGLILFWRQGTTSSPLFALLLDVLVLVALLVARWPSPEALAA